MRDDTAGDSLSDVQLEPTRRGAVLRVARRVLHAGGRRIGLVPASTRVLVPNCARAIAAALAELSGEPIVIVDASLDGRHYDAARPLAPGVSVLSPAPDATVRELVELFGTLSQLSLIDLTGHRQRGTFEWSLTALDGVLVLVVAGQVTDSEVLSVNRAVPDSLWSGVVLFAKPPGSSGSSG